MGLGWSGFAVKGRYAVTQEQRDALEMVTCYDFENGKPLWAHRNETRFSEGMGGDGPRATPQIDGDRVYAFGATGILDCLELATGNLLWSRQVLVENSTANPMYGKSGSPLIVGDQVIVTGGESGPLLIAYDKMTGEPLWKNGTDAAGFSTPVLATLSGVKVIVSVNAKSVTGHDPKSGEERWRWPWPGTMPKPAQPQVIGNDSVLVTASYGLGSHLLKIGAPDPDGKSTVEEIWESSRMKTKFSSACISGDYAYGLDEGQFACINLENGDREWKDGRYGFGQNLLIGDVLLVQAERGQVVLLRATPDGHQELAKMDALRSDTKSWNTPTLAGSYLIVRNDVEAACFRLPVKISDETPVRIQP
ncbi:MAG: PQQ-binding-like beta-propeller repeat protein [Verrucomicrobiales bacterium]